MTKTADRETGTKPETSGPGGPGGDAARDRARRQVDRLWRRGCEFLGTDLAIMGGAMTWVSERNLVAAISNGGGFGVIACGSMNPEQLEAEIAGTVAPPRRPFGVTPIPLHPHPTARTDLCLPQRLGYSVLAG